MVAHGTRNPAGVHSVLQIVHAVRALRPDLEVRPAWIELVEPAVPAVLAGLPADRRAVLVPLLLSSGYHDRVDLPASIAAARPGTAHAAVLGPDPLLAVALADRLDEAGRRPGDAVVLAAAGSSDPDAVASVPAQAALLAAELASRDNGHAVSLAAPGGRSAESRTGVPDPGRPDPPRVTVGFGSAAQPTVPAAVAAARAAGATRVAIAPYLLAPGFFADRLADAGADLVAGPLADHPAVVDLVLHRAASTDR